MNVENLEKKAADKKKSSELTNKRHAEKVELLNSNIKEMSETIVSLKRGFKATTKECHELQNHGFFFQ